MSYALPCINTQQAAAKSTSKGQQPLDKKRMKTETFLI